MMKRLCFSLAAAATLIGCSQPADDDPNNIVICTSMLCEQADTGNNDAVDAGNNVTADAGNNTTVNDDCRVENFCTDAEVCNSATGICVECVTDNECGANGVCDPQKNACTCDTGFHECAGECVDSTSVDSCGTSCTPCPTDPNGTATCTNGMCDLECDGILVLDTASNSCVGCLANTDCSGPSASTCDGGTCVACSSAADCSHITGAPICNGDGVCVECTAGDDSACNGNSCDPANGTCTTTAKASVGACGACVADSECIADHGCVAMEFDGTTRAGGFCLPLEPNDGCSGLYATSVNRTSLSGVTDDYCTLVESVQTCEAIADYGSGCSDASDCGAGNLDDGLCEPIDFEFAKCTVACTDGTVDCVTATEDQPQGTDDCAPNETCVGDKCFGGGQCPSTSLIGCATGGSNGEKWCGAW